MKELHMKICFGIGGFAKQDIAIHHDGYSPDTVIEGLQGGTIITTIEEGGDVVDVADGGWKVIGTVVSSGSEADYTDFDMDEQYEVQTIVSNDKQKEFDMTGFALAGAIGEYIFEPDMSTTEIMQCLHKAIDDELIDINDTGLVIEIMYQGYSPRRLLKEINLMQQGLINMMNVAVEAALDGRKIV